MDTDATLPVTYRGRLRELTPERTVRLVAETAGAQRAGDRRAYTVDVAYRGDMDGCIDASHRFGTLDEVRGLLDELAAENGAAFDVVEVRVGVVTRLARATVTKGGVPICV